jgi:cytochrome P450
VYQIGFHPLAKYPGPFLAKFTNLYQVYYAHKGTQHQKLYQLHQQYGTIVRFGPNHISINDASALEPIYGHQANTRKSSFYGAFYGVNILNIVDKKAHAQKRRVIARGISDKGIREIEPHILSIIQMWCKTLVHQGIKDNEWSKPKDMARSAASLVLDVFGQVGFGRSFNACLNQAQDLIDLMALNLKIVNLVGQMPLLQSINWESYLRHGTIATRRNQLGRISSVLKSRHENKLASLDPDERKDLIYYLENSRDIETGFCYSSSELMSETVILLSAGKTNQILQDRLLT